jgi:uncharacterized repeat protein (TIGR01451 family)
MKRLPFRQGGTLALTLAVLAAVAIALWLGVFSQKWAAGAADGGLNVSIASTPASGTTLAQGNIINYTVTVSSDAVTAAADGNITLLIVLSNATLVAGSFSSPHSIACTGAGPIDCQVPNFAAAGSKTVSFNATVGATGPVLVGAAIDPPVNGSGVGEVDEGTNALNTDDDDGDDPDLTCAAVGEGTDGGTAAEPDNFDCTSHAVGPADLTIGKTAVPAEGTILPLGSTITYTLTASNAGSGTATNVVIRDILGTGLTYVSAGGTGVICTTALPQINCTVASLVPGVNATVTVVATVAASTGTLLNGAYIDPANAITETNEEADDLTLECGTVGEVPGGTMEPDNFDCTTHTGGAVDLTITKTASPAEGTGAKTGDTITYTLTVSNASGATATATNVPIRDILGTGLTYVSAAGTGVTCTHTTAQQIDCTVASIAPSGSATVTIVATVSATTGTVLNGARVDPGNVITETNEDADDPDYDCTAVGEAATTATEPDNFDCTRHTLTAATPTPTPTATVTPGALTNCPLSGRWALSVWDGPSGKATNEALATCTGVTIVAAYSLDRTTNGWLVYFPGRTDINDLLTLSDMQAILTLAQ